VIELVALTLLSALVGDALGRLRDQARRATLEAILPRAGAKFDVWLLELIEDSAEVAAAKADRDLLLDYLSDWLREAHDVHVRSDGLIEFRVKDRATCRLVGDLPVVVFHHTSTAVLPSIRREGIVVRGHMAPSANPYRNSGAGVYVTTESSGIVVRNYSFNAVARHGGDPATLEIVTTLEELAPDPDDEDISTGVYQFVLPYVAPHEILPPER
jgi:hypothetical protein